MGAAHHDIIPRLLPLQVLILQFQLGNVGLVMGQHLGDERASDTQYFQWDFQWESPPRETYERPPTCSPPSRSGSSCVLPLQ